MIMASKNIGIGMLLGEIDANIAAPVGKINFGGNFKDLRAFQELYEDTIEVFKKKY